MNELEISNILFEECKNLIPFKKSKNIIISSRSKGYAVQDHFIELKKKNGEGEIAGWKVALTNIEMQKLTGINEPAEGAIFAPMIYSSYAKIKYSNYGHLGAEAEIAIRIGKDIPKKEGGFTSIEDIIPYVSEVMAALEIVDDRHYGKMANLGLLLGQNSMNQGCIIGEPSDVNPMFLDQLKGDLILNKNIFGSGSGKNVLGHPLEALKWLINSLISRGKSVNSGDIIMTGSIATTCWPEPGDEVIADIAGLKPVKLEVI